MVFATLASTSNCFSRSAVRKVKKMKCASWICLEGAATRAQENLLCTDKDRHYQSF